MTTPFDPLFFALHYIRTHNVDKCQPIDQTIIDDNFSKAYLIADALTVDQLALVSKLGQFDGFNKTVYLIRNVVMCSIVSFQIADQKGAESLKAFKYNEAKALNWLSVKCKKLATALKQQNFHIGAKSLNYVKTEKFAQQSQNGMGFYFDISFHP